MSIVEFDKNMKTNERLSTVILDGLNRIYNAKLNEVLKSDEFAKELVLIGNLYSNQVKNGKTDENSIESFKAYVEGIDKVPFKNSHTDLDVAAKMIGEDMDISFVEFDSRNKKALSASDYKAKELGIKRL